MFGRQNFKSYGSVWSALAMQIVNTKDILIFDIYFFFNAIANLSKVLHKALINIVENRLYCFMVKVKTTFINPWSFQ